MKKIEHQGLKDTRSGFGQGLLELGKENPNVVALCADLTGSLKMNAFKEAFPDRFFQVGIAEANMMGVAAGLSIGDKIPFTGTFANFSTARVYDQIRQSIAYSEKNVKICASHSGLTLGEDGATHQTLEDIGMMKILPHMTVISTCDYNQTRAATKAIAKHYGPVYLRFGRPKVPNFTDPNKSFEIGKANVIKQGTDLTIVANGHLVWQAIQAAEILEEKGVSVELIDLPTIKPLDEQAILTSVQKTQCLVTAEEHQIFGGIGESIAGFLSSIYPVPIEYVGVKDQFGESGKPDDLLKKYGLSQSSIVEAAQRVLKRKK